MSPYGYGNECVSLDLRWPEPAISGARWLSSILPEKFWIMLTFYGDESGTHDARGLKQPGADTGGVFAYAAWENIVPPKALEIVEHAIESGRVNGIDNQLPTNRSRRTAPSRMMT